MVLADFGRPRFTFAGFDFKLGFLFSLEFASSSGLRDMDKPVVLQTLGTEQAGLYAAAFRIVDAATAPIRAVLYATYTRYFRHADKGAEHGIAFGVRVIPFVSASGILLAAFIFVVAGYVPLLLGSEYEGSVDLIRMLAIYPLLLGMAGIGADIMRSIGMQGNARGPDPDFQLRDHRFRLGGMRLWRARRCGRLAHGAAGGDPVYDMGDNRPPKRQGCPGKA